MVQLQFPERLNSHLIRHWDGTPGKSMFLICYIDLVRRLRSSRNILRDEVSGGRRIVEFDLSEDIATMRRRNKVKKTSKVRVVCDEMGYVITIFPIR